VFDTTSGSLPRSGETLQSSQLLNRGRAARPLQQPFHVVSLADHNNGLGIGSSLLVMGFISCLSLILCVLALQLLVRLKAAAVDSRMASVAVLLPATARAVVEEVAVALSAITVALDLGCVLTLSLQCFFVARFSRIVNGEERAFTYIKRCSASRAASTAGFFLSIPAFLLAVMLYAVLEYSFVSAIICVIIFTASIVCFIVTSAHAIHIWNTEKAKSASDKLPLDTASPHRLSKQTIKYSKETSTTKQFKLSTLV
jgi:hypothetical protein